MICAHRILPTKPKSNNIIRIGTIALSLILILIALYCRVRLLSLPLERDEGGFAYVGQQILRGIPPFESANMKVLGGVHFAYALIMALFGENAMGIHAGLMLINLACILLMYFLARRVFLSETAFLAAGVYAYLSVSQTVLGVAAHATHFVIFFVLAGLVALLKYIEGERRLFLIVAGLCFGLSLLMKQHGVFFCLSALGFLAWKRRVNGKINISAFKKASEFGVYMSLPYLVLCAYMLSRGVFAEFWFWTVTYSLDYAGIYSASQGMTFLKDKLENILIYQRYVWLLGGLGFCTLYHSGITIHNRAIIHWLIIPSTISIIPGNAYYRHYFILLIPVLSILIIIGYIIIRKSFQYFCKPVIAEIFALTIVWLAFAASVHNEYDYLFSLDTEQVSRKMYWNDMFPVSVEIAKFIKQNSVENAKIAIIGSEPQIYFYAKRTAATNYLYMYSIDRPHPHLWKMQNEMINEIVSTSPDYIIYVKVYDSWLYGIASDIILNWLNNYLMYYEQVGVIEIGTNNNSICYWGPDIQINMAEHSQSIQIFKRVF